MKSKNNVITFALLGTIDKEHLPFIMSLRQASQDDPNAIIKIILSSEGGEEDIGFAIYDTLKAMPNKVVIEGYGQVSSIASLIFQAADERYLSPNCQFMMHNGSVEMHGDVKIDLVDQMSAHFVKNNARYYKTIADRSKVPVTKIKEWCCEEKFFTAEEAVKAKLADGIVRKI